ncbi:YciI family protein [Kitasatospora sp. NBC_00070]|uniref:YciI family protein n=1 Tax=Kitasatospora sp. NBC_00070 TaxID=2975962 RepID=UPI003245828F
MLHVLLLEFTQGESEVQAHAAGHAEFLESHHRVGTFLLSGSCVAPGRGAVALAVGISREQAERLVLDDPLVRAGAARYTVLTVDPGRVTPLLASVVDVDESRLRPRLRRRVRAG